MSYLLILMMILNAGIITNNMKDRETDSDCRIIRKIFITHCKRGPQRCNKCKAISKDKICLIDICPENAGTVARRVIQIKRNGKAEYREFDVIKQFENSDEAIEYAKEHEITDLLFEDAEK
jgi:hypothetical protein